MDKEKYTGIQFELLISNGMTVKLGRKGIFKLKKHKIIILTKLNTF